MILVISSSLHPDSRSRILARASVDRLVALGEDAQLFDLSSSPLPQCDGATAYGDAWRAGQTWPEGPNPIDIDFVTRAGYLWQHSGGQYIDTGNPKPLGWVPAP